MPRHKGEELLDRGIGALTGVAGSSEAAREAHDLLECVIALERAGQGDKLRLQKQCDYHATRLDCTHPIDGMHWLSWAVAMATFESGLINRGHALRRLAAIRDTK